MNLSMEGLVCVLGRKVMDNEANIEAVKRDQGFVEGPGWTSRNYQGDIEELTRV
jgi:hypothetical protein